MNDKPRTPDAGIGPSPTTKTTRLTEIIRTDIQECRLLPGTKLRFEALRETYGASMGGLREAMMPLVAEDLVIATERTGFKVAPVSREHLMDITQMRQVLESMAIRRSIELGDDLWEAKIIAGFHLLSKVDERSGEAANRFSPEWVERHWEFHDALANACGSPILIRFRRTLFDQTQRYRQLALLSEQQPRSSLEEHQQIMDACLARDADAACALMDRHIVLTTDTVLANPSIFSS